MSRFARFLLILLLGFAEVSPALAARERMSAEDAYSLGLRYLKRGYYQKALEQFQRVRTYFRDDPYALKAELAIADLHFKKNEWDSARLAYEDFMRAHPRYKDLDYVVYRLGLTVFRKAPAAAGRDQTWTNQAVHTWSTFQTRFPDSAYRDDVTKDLDSARNRLARKELVIARFYARRSAWPAVLGRAERMLAQYPDSTDRLEALMLVGEAAHGLDQPEKANAVLGQLDADPDGAGWARELRRSLSRPARQAD